MNKEISAKLIVEECGLTSKSDSSPDAERQYVVHSKHFLAEGEIYFHCRPSKLDETLDQIFKTRSASYTSGSYYGSYGSRYYGSSTPTGTRKERRFLTRDPIYAPKAGEVKDLLKNAGRAITGRDNGEGFDLFCDLIDEMISPPKRNY